MIKHILDASAVLAVLNGERGEKKVIPILAESAVSTVNLTEVVAKLLETGMDEAECATRGFRFGYRRNRGFYARFSVGCGAAETPYHALWFVLG